jgi:hypothetical protein
VIEAGNNEAMDESTSSETVSERLRDLGYME